jgi:hypothetical protein
VEGDLQVVFRGDLAAGNLNDGQQAQGRDGGEYAALE